MINKLKYIKYKIKRFIDMYPRIRTYGIRYFYDKEYRRKMKQKEDGKKRRKKYGAGFLSRAKEIKINLSNKYGPICQICKYQFPLIELTIDHIQKRCDGGSNKYDNLQLLCTQCHVMKDAPQKSYSPFECLLETN